MASSSRSSSKSVTYSSTRGCPSQKSISFRTAVMRGLAHDRGLFVPETIPHVSAEELESWRPLGYADLAVEVIAKFVKDDEVPRDILEGIVHKSCDAFRSEEVTPLVKVDGHYVLVSSFVNYVACSLACSLFTCARSVGARCTWENSNHEEV